MDFPHGYESTKPPDNNSKLVYTAPWWWLHTLPETKTHGF